MKNLFLACVMVLFTGTVMAQQTSQKKNTTKIVSDPTANPKEIDPVKNQAVAKKSKSEKIGTGKKQQVNTTKIVSDPTAHPLHVDTIKNVEHPKNKNTVQKASLGKKQQPNTTKVVSDPTANPVHLDTIKNPVKK